MLMTVADVIKMYDSGSCPGFEFFYQTKNPFSNWHPAKFTEGNVEYWCSEQYMMAGKALFFGDVERYKLVMTAKEQPRIKSLGRSVTPYDDRKWSEVRASIVLKANLLKFSQNDKLKEILLGTGNKILVEASPYDDIWGIAMGEEEKGIENPHNWRGQNLLGFTLMATRALLRKEEQD